LAGFIARLLHVLRLGRPVLLSRIRARTQFLAGLEDRSAAQEIRHLIALGLEQERERLLHAKWRPKQVGFVKRFLQFLELLGED
jgi:hypothetical protein